MENSEERTEPEPLHPLGAACLREYAYNNGADIYSFMKRYDIGESDFGSIMDQAAKGQHVIAHRLFGHHLVYDFPIDNPQVMGDFLEHEFSDLFTKQGLPIIPGDMLKDAGMLKYCNQLTANWNFVNGFDILSATIAIYQSVKSFNAAFRNEYSIQDIEGFAKSIGVGALEAAIAFSTANPFLLIGSVIQLTAGIRALFNEGCVVSFSLKLNAYGIEVILDELSLSNILRMYDLSESLDNLGINKQIEQCSLEKMLEQLK